MHEKKEEEMYEKRNGIGNVLLNALNTSDLPVVMGAVLVVSIIFVIINVLVDIIYGLIDPRVRVS